MIKACTPDTFIIEYVAALIVQNFRQVDNVLKKIKHKYEF